jgi:hypothetical protein
MQCGNIILLTIRYFDVEKFTTLTQLSSLILCKLWFENIFSPYFCIEISFSHGTFDTDHTHSSSS